jgi:AcrR family transcriptional regulator
VSESAFGSLRGSRKRLTREEKKAETRAALLDAAARTFGRRGYYAASVEEVAEEAGYSKGAVYSNFDSKEDLFMTLLEERPLGWVSAISTLLANEEQVEPLVMKSGQFMTDLVERDREWSLLFFDLWTYASRDKNLERRVAGMYEQSRAQAAQMIEAKSKELNLSLPMPAEDIAAAVIALSDGFYLQKVVDAERFPPDFLGRILLMFFGGLVAIGPQPVGQVFQELVGQGGADKPQAG